MHGVLIIDKPAGPTSHDVVARVRRAIGISRIGHTGTLDPLATGVLALVVGRATRLAQFLSSDEKEYLAGVRLGSATATYDAEDRMVRGEHGELTLQPPRHPAPDFSEDALRAALAPFVGPYAQLPPPFSAKKIAGTPAYMLARLQKQVELKPANVSVRTLDLVSLSDGLATLRIVSSSGFYVRSLAHDLGQRLGCGAHLESLRRTRAGEFRVDQATPLDVVRGEGIEALDAARAADGAPLEAAASGGHAAWRQTCGSRQCAGGRGSRRDRRRGVRPGRLGARAGPGRGRGPSRHRGTGSGRRFATSRGPGLKY